MGFQCEALLIVSMLSVQYVVNRRSNTRLSGVVVATKTWCLTKQKFGRVSLWCDEVGCHVSCLRRGIPMWQHCKEAAILEPMLPASGVMI